ncbi:MAG: hypothetical protein COZ20_02620 [Gallionellales bacterium CG_4_10_14_3_um_filter_54_96]|nr:MAG: hypothetical protein COW45_04065 [Gallionellales bacterium CG17_big_fil_post_rev_8_21_14_2_50_54_146]PIX04953.1 MAG: hypothetical protein COZ77_03810 [Gallionellales bacterium CG_4_8_14_3_um_filter_54_18]PIY05807.1 MAG: hypothetical protein COZ20_02620 [Gallionellales bacterium CG_4_10_14_3_um_filter_54_96]
MSYQWLYISASVTGPSHSSSNTPCQDASHTSASPDGQWLAIAVCDGAGSALRPKDGADLVAKSFANRLLSLSAQFSSRLPGAWVNDFVIQQILDVRSELRKLAGSDDLNDFHSTLVACLLGPNGGFSIHIGDGALFGGTGSGASKDGYVYLDNNFFISKPANGEYANETFFITEGNWIKNLRITPLPQADWVIVGSDGGCALCLDSGDQPKPEFVAPLITLLSKHSSSEWASLLQATLADSKADLLTNDDKTLVICMRDSLLQDKGASYRYTDPNTPKKNPATAKPTTAPTGNHALSSAFKVDVEAVVNCKNNWRSRHYISIAILFALVIALLVCILWAYPSAHSKIWSQVNSFIFSEKSNLPSDEQKTEPPHPANKLSERHSSDDKPLKKPEASAASGTQI